MRIDMNSSSMDGGSTVSIYPAVFPTAESDIETARKVGQVLTEAHSQIKDAPIGTSNAFWKKESYGCGYRIKLQPSFEVDGVTWRTGHISYSGSVGFFSCFAD